MVAALDREQVAPSSVSRPLKRCPTTDANGGQVAYGGGKSIRIVARPSVAKRIVGFDAGIAVAGPAGWRCSSFIYGDGGQNVAIYPRGERRPAFGKSSDPFPRPRAIVATFIPACAGCKADLVCPFFRAAAAKYGFPCQNRIASGERVTRRSSTAVLFEDPPGVRGTGRYSGGRLRIYGVVINVPDKASHQGYALKLECALSSRWSRSGASR
jgi:hypothetical protein